MKAAHNDGRRAHTDRARTGDMCTRHLRRGRTSIRVRRIWPTSEPGHHHSRVGRKARVVSQTADPIAARTAPSWLRRRSRIELLDVTACRRQCRGRPGVVSVLRFGLHQSHSTGRQRGSSSDIQSGSVTISGSRSTARRTDLGVVLVPTAKPPAAATARPLTVRIINEPFRTSADDLLPATAGAFSATQSLQFLSGSERPERP
jgi:hypothetical protein